jgi:DNA replication and repair protein RecF
MNQKLGINSLGLINFRNYTRSYFDFDTDSAILFGENGTGKTSILEAISLLCSGKGIRGALIEEIIKKDSAFAEVYANVNTPLGKLDIKTVLDFNKESMGFKKKSFIDNDQVKNQIDLENYISCLWLTPQMDNFFLQDNTHKRKFIDKMIFILDKSHGSRLNELEKLIKERNKILLSTGQNNIWLNAVEEKIAEVCVALVITRLIFLENLNNILKDNSHYPLYLSFSGYVEDLVEEHKFALKVENSLKQTYINARKKDMLSGITSIGAHRSKLFCYNLKNEQEAQKCSTGEQKMLLLNIMLAFIKILRQNKRTNLILLLDEINVHLDCVNTHFIIDEFLNFQTQLFITTTNSEVFNAFKDKLKFISVNN